MLIGIPKNSFKNKIFFRCIANKKDMVTASYCTEAMQALHQEAQIAGISVVNEVGLDPGKFPKKYQGIFQKIVKRIKINLKF